jgi:hypothetical protein
MNLVILRPPAGEPAPGLTGVAVPAPFVERRPPLPADEPYWRLRPRGRSCRRPGSRVPAELRHRLALRWAVRQRCRWRT